MNARPLPVAGPRVPAWAALLAAALTGLACESSAQTLDSTGAMPITLDQAVTMARENRPNVIQAAGARRVAQVSRRATWAEFIPTFSLSAGATRQLPSEGERTRVENGQIILLPAQPWSHNIGMNASVDVFTGFRRLFNIQESGARLHAARVEEVVQRYAATLAVKQSYFDVLAARESGLAAEAQLAQAEQQHQVTVGKVRARTATRSDSLRAEIQVRNGRLAVLDARTALEVANASLTRAVGSGQPVTAAETERLDIPEPVVDEAAIPALAEQGPLILSAKADYEAAKAARRATYSSYLPSLTASYQRGGSGVGDELVLNENDLSYSGSMRLSLSLPIFNQFQRELQGAQAKAALDNAEANMRDARLAVREGLLTSVGTYRAARERVASQIATLEAAEEDLRVQRQRYTVGGSTLLDVLASQTQLNNARVDLIRSRYDLRIARAQIEALVGEGPVKRIGITTIVILVALTAVVASCARTKKTNAALAFETVARRDITLTIEASGAVEPIDLVEVKSKASGQIVKMPVDVGSLVRQGALLAQIDISDVKNQYDQAYAAMRAAQSKSDISRAQKSRSDQLYKEGIITAPEHEAATLDLANSQSSLVKARTDLDIARTRLADATVRAPITGTILEQTVAVGQVIASATSSVSGGTTLLKMADLSRIRLRALVSETDVGNVHPGQTATVTVDAFPNRSFEGQVEKIEPQAVVQQSVTMFPVLISIANEGGVLLPGMNGEVTMIVDRRENVVAVPVDAVRSVREVQAMATALGVRPDSARAQVERQMAARSAERAGGMARADSGRGGPLSGGSGAGATGAAGAQGRGDDAERLVRIAERRFNGDTAAARRWMNERQASGGGSGGGGRDAGTGNWSGSSSGSRSGSWAGGRGGSSGPAPAGGVRAGMSTGGSGGGGGMRGSRAQVVFVKAGKSLEARVIRLGLSDFDYAEVITGVQEGEEVALLGVAEAQAQRTQAQQNMRQRMGSGVVPGAGGGAGGRGGGGGSGGSGSGGSRPSGGGGGR